MGPFRWLDGLRAGVLRVCRRKSNLRSRQTAVGLEPLESRVVLTEDYGDAPDTGTGTGRGNYQTFASDNGPHHTLGSAIYLGSSPSPDTDARMPADRDESVSTTTNLSFTVGTQPAVGINVTNNTGSAANLSGWIDYNANGVFDASEQAQAVLPSGYSGNYTLMFPPIPAGFTGTTYARFRISTDPAAKSPVGAAVDGEVEDYPVAITNPAVGAAASAGVLGSIPPNSSSRFGQAVASLGDLDGDGITDMAVGDWGYRGVYGGNQRGAVYILLMNSDGSAKTYNKISSGTKVSGTSTDVVTLANRDLFGRSLCAVGDVDGDGVVDLAVGAPGQYYSGQNNAQGAVYVLRLKSDGSVKAVASKTANGTLGLALNFNDNFGMAVAGIGDLTGDGISELAVGAPGDDTGASNAGAVYVFSLDNNGVGSSKLQITSTTSQFHTLSANARFGSALANLGDLDGNGAPDLAAVESGTGLVDIIQLGRSAFFFSSIPVVSSTTIPAGQPGGHTGAASVAGLGDINGDGVPDLGIGAPGDDTGGTDRGAVFVVTLSSRGAVRSTSKIADGSNGGPALANTEGMGQSLANLGDLNGDGRIDLAVGEVAFLLKVNLLSLAAGPALRDFGDAPDTGSGTARGNYRTLAADFGPSHGIVDSLWLGSRVSGESNALQNNIATGDDLGIDDEDGVINPLADLLITGGSSPKITLQASNLTGTAATLFGWIDADADGVFDSSERAQITVPTGTSNGRFTLTFPVTRLGYTGKSFARFRLSTDTFAADPSGAVADGEVEDYAVTIVNFSTGTVKSNTKIASSTNGGPSLTGGDVFGTTVTTLGDLDGDGIVDLAVGADQDDTGANDAGAVYIQFLNANGTVKSNTKIASGIGGGPTLSALDRFGHSVAGLGDLDGDGVSDLAVGAFLDDAGGTDTGAVYILFLNSNGTVKSSKKISSGTNAAPTLTASDRFGGAMANVGDLDGDGIADLAVTASGDDTGGTNRGAVYLLRLNKDGTPKNTTKIADGINGGPTLLNNSAFGGAVANLGDLDGDGITELGVGATDDTTGGNARGAVYVLRLNSNGTVKSSTKIAHATNGGPNLADVDFFGASIASVGDLDGDGIPDMAVGATGNDTTGASNVGAVYVLRMNANGTVKSSTKISSSLNGGPALSDGDYFGSAIANLGDLDGDGVTDLAVGAVLDNTGSSNRGALYIVRLNVAPNIAPTLDNTGNPFAILGVGSRQSAAMQQGTLVSEILARGAKGNPIGNASPSALKGIAITSADTRLGTFQYTLVSSNPQESDWKDIDSHVSNSFAQLLPETARLRFKTSLVPHHTSGAPFLPLESKLNTGLIFRAWNQTAGAAGNFADTSVNGGTTAFSSAAETVKVYFEARLFRSFNTNASLNVYTLEAEFNALLGNPAFKDRSTDGYSGFTILMSDVPELGTVPLYRMYFGVQFNGDGTETDMGYRYLTSQVDEAAILEGQGPANQRPQRAGAYFRELGVNASTAVLGYIYSAQQPGTAQMTQVYRTDAFPKPTRPGGTPEGSPSTTTRTQEQGDHVYTTNTSFETSRPGTWRIEATRGFVRELTPSPTGVGGTVAPVYAQSSVFLADASGSTSTFVPSPQPVFAAMSTPVVTVTLPTVSATLGQSSFGQSTLEQSLLAGLMSLDAFGTATAAGSTATQDMVDPIPQDDAAERWESPPSPFAIENPFTALDALFGDLDQLSESANGFSLAGT